MAFDFNHANDAGTPIPAGEIVAAKLALEPGFGTSIPDATMSRSSDALFAVFKLHVIHPKQHVGRMIWDRPGLVGKGGATDSFYAHTGRFRLRRYIESARGVEHDDMSDEAMAKRRIGGLNEMHGMKVIVRIEHELDSQGTKRMIVGEVLTESDFPGYQDTVRDMGGDRRPPLGCDDIPDRGDAR